MGLLALIAFHLWVGALVRPGADMAHAAGGGELLLAFALGKTGAVNLAVAVGAMRALLAGDEQTGFEVFRTQGFAAGVAERVTARLQPVFDSNPAVEDETFAAPQAVIFRHGLEVFQDPALEMKNVFNALRLDEGCGLFAAYAAGAIHGDTGIGAALAEFAEPIGEFAEIHRLRIDGALELADADLVVISGVDGNDILGRDEVIPVLRLDIGADNPGRVGTRNAHGDDFLLQSHLHAQKGLVLGPAFLVLQIRKAGQAAQIGEHRLNTRLRPGDRAIDAFAGEQQGAEDVVRLAHRFDLPLQGRICGERSKLVQRSDKITGHGDGLDHLAGYIASQRGEPKDQLQGLKAPGRALCIYH